MIKFSHLFGMAGCVYLWSAIASATQAQIVPDATLPTNSTITINGNTNTIEGGTQAGSNLFHSFQEFSIPTGSSAFFNNALDIQNIFSRITGGSISNIDGLIKANGTANLFLLNPNGIIFGPNAQLNIGGSFFASTANSIRFADNTEFSASNPQTSPLLTVSVPIGLQFGVNPGQIVVQGNGNNLSIDSETYGDDVYIRDERPVGLQVNPGQTLALLGRDILLDSGNLTAPSGRIELGSVATEGNVNLTSSKIGWVLGYQEIHNFGDISLNKAASVDTSGEGGGSIQVQSRQLSLGEGSAFLALTLGSSNGIGIDIRAADSIRMSGVNSQGVYSFVAAETNPNSTGNAGNITVETGNLILDNGALISSSTFGAGHGGSLTIRASESVELKGVDPNGLGSFLGTEALPGSTGNAGDLIIETGSLILQDGAAITSATEGKGNGGSLTVRAAESVELMGADKEGTGSALQTTVGRESLGNAGNLAIETRRLSVRDGGQISAGTSGAGSASTLTVKATDSVDIRGTSADGETPSSLNTSVEQGATGAGGNLTVETGRLIVGEGARISTTTASASAAGNLTVKATDSVELIGTGKYLESLEQISSFTATPSIFRNGLFTISFGSGNAGNMTIETRRFIARDGALAQASNFGGGERGGQMTFNATDAMEVSASLLSNGNGPGSIGRAGDLTINTQNLTMRDGAIISTGTAGFGRGGNLTINATESIQLIGGNPYFVLGKPGDTALNASSVGPAPAGDLTISTRRLTISNGANASTTTFASGRGGSLTVKATDTLTIDGISGLFTPSALTGTTQGSGDAGNVSVTAGTLIIRNGGLIAADSLGIGSAGNLEITASLLRLDRQGFISARTAVGDRGNIIVQTDDGQLRGNSAIVTDASGTATGGNIIINTDTIVTLQNSNITANAVQGQGGNINLNAIGVFLSPGSNITATSEFGLSGTVEVRTPNGNVENAFAPISANFAIADTLLANSCDVRRRMNNSITVTGTGGLPPNPFEVLSGRYTVAGVQGLSTGAQGYRGIGDYRILTPLSAIQEAQGIAVTPNGRTMLLTQAQLRAIGGEGQGNAIANANDLICK
ncbi:filamentous hemagglutinin N-terminal domain-containing protein [Planktothrix sp. FACHB-1355]|uniref:Filamentous hemagglutinin N-terminal domain-containing protein n=1 Tax=Aerosakkonema funiforme FACHB-1375 TaxID=2949571 RepID=A0A926VF75_9CYAN|nr:MULTISPECIES: filamentous hemagglutinin N-terminal domain-containing protein [Oscillatoriales]MBD2181409.1 filamentous hemagglutinin N-terminal domain-containing protein [Aerosakkonema funiforme FACHB-1375]MBD3558335.1 filamentous hemagglutinin N-terminal domain-containing protein [Planktothrix sp. FACHB-1355]